MKAGLLLPRSGAWPSISVDFIAAIRNTLKLLNREDSVQFISENINFGGSDKEVYEKAEKLLVIEGVDILVAYIDMKVIPLLEPLLFATDKLLIVVNAGANYPEKKIPKPGIIHLTMQHAFLCSLTGKAAGNSAGIYATTFYDCGYMHGAAMLYAFEQNNGSILFNYVNNDLYDDTFNINALTDFLDTRTEEKLNLICIFDEKPAALFYSRLNKYRHADRLSLFVSPMMLTPNAIGGGNYRFSIQGYTSLPPQENTEASLTAGLNNDFGIFSMSGIQTGLMLNAISGMSEHLTSSGADIVNRLHEITIPAPGGILRLDPQTHFYIPDQIYKCILPAGTKDLIIAPEKTESTDWDRYLGGRNDLLYSGWTNTYLCY